MGVWEVMFFTWGNSRGTIMNLTASLTSVEEQNYEAGMSRQLNKRI